MKTVQLHLIIGTSLIKVIPVSALVTLRTFIWKTDSFRKLSITFYSFGLKQFGKLHVVGHKLLHFAISKVYYFLKNTYAQGL